MSLASEWAKPVGIVALSTGAYYLVRLAVVAGGASLFLRTQIARALRVYRIAYSPGQFKSEWLATCGVIVLDAMVAGITIHFRWVQEAGRSLSKDFFSFALLFMWIEFWFYATHRLFHLSPLYFIHRQHHVAKVVHPLSALSFSLAERAFTLLGFQGFAILASHWLPITRTGMIAYLLANYILNVWGHLNVELIPGAFLKKFPGKMFITSSFHAMHHARYKGHYGLFTTVLDRFLGTFWADYPQVHDRARRGEGLLGLGERIEAGAE